MLLYVNDKMAGASVSRDEIWRAYERRVQAYERRMKGVFDRMKYVFSRMAKSEDD